MNRPAESELWRRIEGFSMDAPGTALTFVGRLARENGWSQALARRALVEYRRFLYLAMTAGHPVTPSDAVDQVWHLHLTYTRSYWEDLCGRILGRPLHHEPTRGGSAEGAKFEDWYERTRDSYEKAFGETPPIDLWPPSRVRFGEDLRHERVNRARNWVIAKPGFGECARVGGRLVGIVGGVVALVGLGTGCSAMAREYPFSLNGPAFLVFFPIFAALVFGAAAVLRWALRGPGDGSTPAETDLDPHLVATLAGGHGRAVQSAVVALAARGAVVSNPRSSSLLAGSTPEPGAHPLERAVYACLDPVIGQSLREVTVATKGLGGILREDLERRGWWLTPAGVRYATGLPLAVAALVPVLGIARIAQGISTEHSVGFLVLMTLASVAVVAGGFGRPAGRTRAGAAVLARLRGSHRELKSRRTRSSVAAGALPLAVGLFGSSVLAETELARLRRILQPADQEAANWTGTSGCSAGSGGGDGGGGGGGGGCGGCGGGGGGD